MDNNNNSHSDISDSEEGRSLKRKKIVPKKYYGKYQKKWENDIRFNKWIGPNVNRGEHYAFCKYCNVDISIKSGVGELMKHSQSSKHKRITYNLQNQRTITNLPEVSRLTNLERKTKEAELRLAAFISEHNLPFNLMGHLPKLIQEICKDSETAKSLKMGRTKATVLVKNVLGKEQFEIICEDLKRSKFSLIIDESTDKSTLKHLCLVIRYFDKRCNNIVDCFFTLIEISDGTADNLYKNIVQVFEDNRITYKDNLCGFAADGASVMFGKNNSVSKLLANDVNHLYTFKCICHSFALCASYASTKLPADVEDLLRSIYNYIGSSPKRIAVLKEFQDFLDTKPHKMLHPCQTRWLSMEAVVKRILEQYEPLKLYFIDAVTTDRLESASNILEKLNDLSYKAFLEFLEFILPVFNDLNKQMQSEKVQIHVLHENIMLLTKTILDCYMKNDYLQKNTLDAIEFSNPRHFVPLESVYLGVKAISTIKKLSSTQQHFVRTKCLDFLIEAVRQIKQRYNFKDNPAKLFGCLDPLKIKNPEFYTISDLVDRFKFLVDSNIQTIDSEWRKLRNYDFSNCPVDDVTSFWIYISKIQLGNEFIFSNLCKFVFNVLTLPHSSANVERVFSQINLLKTDQRNRLETETLAGILHTKALTKRSACFEFKIEQSLLNRFNVNMYDFKD